MTRAKQTVERTPAPFARGQQVQVNEPGIRTWSGTVRAVKFSAISGWWIEIQRDDGGWYAVPAEVVR